nr:reverse transcriptase domain-containing protein [Tanacetum cinerariifolium]GEY06442.1 reverse transcriptase domain-containing protein [Tanacetum cinerariifolium]
PNEEHELEDEDTRDPSKDSNETEPFKEDETAVTPPPPRHRGARMSASLGHRAAMIHKRDDILKEDIPHQRRFAFTAPPPGFLVMMPGLLLELLTEHRMLVMKESKYFYTQLHDAQTDHRDIRLEIDVVRGHTTTYETELQESVEDLVVTQMMRIHTLEARARTDSVEDADSSCGGLRRPVQPVRVCSYTDFMKCQPLNFKGTEGIVGLSEWLEKMESVFHISGCVVDNQVKFATCTMLGATLTWWNGHVRTLGHKAVYAMTWGTFKKKMMDKYCPKGEIKKLKIEL